jgi:hypothetical protein
MTVWSTEATPKHERPISVSVPSSMRPAFGSIFWPVLAAILASLLVVGAVGALVTAEIIHKADQSLNTVDQFNEGN